jgi:hypothetical protein
MRRDTNSDDIPDCEPYLRGELESEAIIWTVFSFNFERPDA